MVLKEGLDHHLSVASSRELLRNVTPYSRKQFSFRHGSRTITNTANQDIHLLGLHAFLRVEKFSPLKLK
jgi:hypothetical protein